MFGQDPLNATTLASRLARFWKQSSPHPLVVADAVGACKSLIRSDRLSPKPKLNYTAPRALGLRAPPKPSELLHRLYSHKPLLVLLDNKAVQKAVFLDDPRPGFDELQALLKHTSAKSTHYMALRTELQRGDLSRAFEVLDLAPEGSIDMTRYQVGTALTTFGVVSGIIWQPWWIVSIPLVIFWLGLASIVTIRPPSSLLVEWTPRVKTRHRSQMKLEMAHLIMTWYEDTQAHTTANYHRLHSLPSSEDMDRKLRHALHQRGMRLRSLTSSKGDVYIEYWTNPTSADWEWVEPDQDPAFYRWPIATRTHLHK